MQTGYCKIVLLGIMLQAISFSVRSQEKNQLTVKGLQATVEVLRDKWGVNHIYAANQHDLFFAQGYCAAKDRLFQFEIWRRQANGTLAEILGPSALQRDIAARLFAFKGDMKKELNHYHPQGADIITAFTDGVNAYIDEPIKDSASLPIEFHLLHIMPGKWTPAIVVSRHQGIMVNVAEELNIGRSVAAIGDKKVKELLWLHPGNPSLQLDSNIDGSLLNKDILALYNEWHKDVQFTTKDIADKNAIAKNILPPVDETLTNNISRAELEGSNNWTVSGNKTANGHTMLASDPHRKIALPSLRYIVHLNAPGWNVMGAGEPEIPGVAIGHNNDGAWGITVHQTDIEDLYVYDLNPQQLNQYRYKGDWVDMTAQRESITVKGSAPVNTTLYYTKHGPVVFIDSANHKAYAIRATWLQQGTAPYLGSLRIDQAKDWNSFRDACSFSLLPSLNMIWADKKGNIGWQVTGAIPVRKNFSGLVPIPGDGRFEWSGILPIKERPHDFNPTKGYIATANEDLVPKNFTHPDAAGFSWPDGYRAKRLNEVLSKSNGINIEKMKSLQTDYFSIPATETVPLLNAIQMDNALSQKAKTILLHWNFIMDKNSIAAAIYNKWEREMKLMGDQQFIPAAIKGLINLQTTKLNEWPLHPDEKFGTNPLQGRDLFLKTSFEAAIAKLQKQLGDDINNWQFGQEKYKHSQFIHPLANLLNDQLQQQLNTTSLPRGGYGHTVGATGNQDNQDNGASFRYITDTDNWDSTLMINTPGQSGNPTSPWYKNLFPLWANDEYFPAYFSKEKIKKVTAEIWLLSPLK